MGKVAGRLGALATLALLVVAGSTIGTAEAQSKIPAQSSAHRFRESLGLAASQDVIERSYRQPDVYVHHDYGVPLTRDEAEEVERRIKIQEALDPVVSYAEDQPDFGGLYVDQRHGGKVVIQFTNDLGRHVSAVAERVPEWIDTDVRIVDNTYRHLRLLQRTVEADIDRLPELGVDATSVGVDVVKNAVVVGLAEEDDTAAALLQAMFDGPFVTEVTGRLSLDACTDRYHCPSPPVGGLELVSTNSGGHFCTSAFVGRKNEGAGGLVLFTAGHCIVDNGGLNHDWQHGNNASYATSFDEEFGEGASADVGVFDGLDFAAGEDRNRLYATGPNDRRSLYYKKANSAQQVGYLVCRAGAASDSQCGEVHNRFVTKQSEGRTIHNQFVVNFDACGGDSGGAYYLGNSAWGVHSDSSTGCHTGASGFYAWYTTMDFIESETPWDICLTDTCPAS